MSKTCFKLQTYAEWNISNSINKFFWELLPTTGREHDRKIKSKQKEQFKLIFSLKYTVWLMLPVQVTLGKD